MVTARIIGLILYSYKGACAYLENSGIGRINIGAPDTAQVVVYYFLLVLAVWWPLIHIRFNVIGSLRRNIVTGMIVVLALFLFCIRPCRGLDVYMLDVGQGDCMVIRNDNKNVYIIDGGSSSVKKVGEYRIIPCLKWMVLMK